MGKKISWSVITIDGKEISVNCPSEKEANWFASIQFVPCWIIMIER